MRVDDIELGMLIEHQAGVGRVTQILPHKNSVVLETLDGERKVSVPLSRIKPQPAPADEADWY